jgi:diguanylate cyclase (GGDEF)-like protein
MKDDIRYSEFLFLRAIEKWDQKFQYININNPEQQKLTGLNQTTYSEMVVALAENSYVVFDEHDLQLLIGRLRGEISPNFPSGSIILQHEWQNPRDGIHNRLISSHAFRLRVTYRGLCRIEELRELLKRDRILEPFGVLLDMRYFYKDFEDALRRPPDVPVSVLRLDLDGFKKINDASGHPAGDEVMKNYLEAVRDCVGSIGDGYRGRGDEVAVLIVGQEHKRVLEIAEKLRVRIETRENKFKDIILPSVTASIGLATTPPESRGKDLETIADDRQIRAKKEGKNRVVGS